MTLIDANRDKLADQIKEAKNYMQWRNDQLESGNDLEEDHGTALWVQRATRFLDDWRNYNHTNYPPPHSAL